MRIKCLLACCFTLFLLTSTASSAAELSIYQDNLAQDWADWSWNTAVNFNNRAPRQNGSYSLSVRFDSPWAGLYLRYNDALDPAAYSSLRFWLQGGKRGGQIINLSLYDSASQSSQSVTITPIKREWQLIDIPLSEFGPVSEIAGVVWQDATGSKQQPFYLDDISLVLQDQPPPPLELDVTINTDQINGPISPDIYGMSFADPALAEELALPLQRWGGNATTRYNFLNDTSNRASDWFFLNVANVDVDVAALPDDSSADQFVEQNQQNGSQTLMTLPLIGWTPKSRVDDCGFRISLYGPQQSVSPYRPDCGNGIALDGTPIVGNNPSDTSSSINSSFVQDWINHLTSRFGTAANGGVRYYNLDNEPMLWPHTHRDVHPEFTSYDELLARTVDYAAAIKAADPAAQTLGPVLWGWTAYSYSALDTEAGGAWWTNPVDRLAHGDMPLVEWYLQQLHNHEQTKGVRLLDYLDLHFYPQAASVFNQDAGSGATQALRLRSTRALWDADYSDESWIGEPVQLIPRMQAWVDQHYPGTKLALSEYNWGALDHINGALTQADILGIFGREGLDLAALWDPPTADQAGAYAFRLYLNYDGSGSRFGDTSVASTSSNQEQLASYAALRSSDGALTLMVINKTSQEVTTQFSLNDFTPAGEAELYQYSAGDPNQIVQLPALSVTDTGFSATFPANSITHVVLLPQEIVVPPPPPPPPPTDCWPSATAVGALPEQPAPVFCSISNSGPGTALAGTNTWLDDFNHGLSFADFTTTAYNLYEAQGDIHKSIQWRHADHWMVDLVPNSEGVVEDGATGGALLQPQQAFRFSDGKLIVEADYAAGIEAYGQNTWGEIVVSNGSQPSGFREGGSLYGYDLFPGDWTLGCRLQADRTMICSLMDNTERGSLQGGRVWEMSFFQQVGTTNYGGGSWVSDGQYFRLCGDGDPDSNCRDRFRLELTETSVTVYVNGLKYFEQTGIPPLPQQLLAGDVYVYLASMTSRSSAETLRYHWDRVAVNPDTPPTAAEGFVIP